MYTEVVIKRIIVVVTPRSKYCIRIYLEGKPPMDTHSIAGAKFIEFFKIIEIPSVINKIK